MAEVRTHDLRFTLEEARVFLNRRFVYDFLSEEVLAAQAMDIQSFPLKSSVLELGNSREILHSLEAQHLFTVCTRRLFM